MSLKIAIATTSDNPLDPRSWSGTPFTIMSALKKLNSVEVCLLGPVKPGLRLTEGFKKYYWKMKGKRFLWERELRIIQKYRKEFLAKIQLHQPDVILTLGTVAAASLPSNMDYVVYVDTTFQLNVDYYPSMMNICAPSLLLGDKVDQSAFERARHIIVTSEWAARSIENDYGIKRERVSVIPIGAQHVSGLNLSDILSLADNRICSPIRLLWVGVEWERKGGDIAVEIARELNKRGYPTMLDVVGFTPGSEVCSLPFIKSHGFLDARTDIKKIEGLFLTSLFLLLPSRAENTSVVISDSSSFGLPVLASDTGGMRTMIKDGENGFIFPIDNQISLYTDIILKHYKSKDQYIELVRRTKLRYERELSWDVSMKNIHYILEKTALGFAQQ